MKDDHSTSTHSVFWWVMHPVVQGHQPEMPDSVKLLLGDATYLGFHTDCVLKSID